MTAQILVVEDELIGQQILLQLLQQAGHRVVLADSGAQAWGYLNDSDQVFDVILLDRNLPDINGLDLLVKIQKEERLKSIPVILQTAMAEPDDVRTGLKLGAYYYVTKPLDPASLLVIVDSAIRHIRVHRSLQEQIQRTASVLSYMTHAEFRFQTPEQASSIAALLCSAWPSGGNAMLGLSELMLNAVEHGNLAIDYQDKSQLLESGCYWDEVHARLRHPDFANRQATVRFERDVHQIRFWICDQGKGFDWRSYLDMSPQRALHSHGRGIAMAKMISFSELHYQDPGNSVLAICQL